MGQDDALTAQDYWHVSSCYRHKGRIQFNKVRCLINVHDRLSCSLIWHVGRSPRGSLCYGFNTNYIDSIEYSFSSLTMITTFKKHAGSTRNSSLVYIKAWQPLNSMCITFTHYWHACLLIFWVYRTSLLRTLPTSQAASWLCYSHCVCCHLQSA